MILRAFEQDVQISGTRTGSPVCATFKNHEAVRVSSSYYLGTRYRGTVFDVQDARMSRVHGCIGATLVTSCGVSNKK